MGYLSKRRGVISVFLLIIFMITYVFMGLLVDAGRYRMAQTYAEAALDSASSSVLSNYNKLVYDLYGLFSVDIKLEKEQSMEEAIGEAYQHYLKEMLEMVDAKEYETMLAELITGKKTAATLNTGSLYDFEITELKADTSITLADTANVENQIIEYMKYRAPVQLTDDMKGFLGKLQVITEMKDRVQEALTKEKIKEKYETEENGNVPLSTEAAELLTEINSFAGTLYQYTIAPHNAYSSLASASAPSASEVYNNNPQRIKNYCEEFDTALKKAENAYQEATEKEEETYKKNLRKLLKELQDKMIKAQKEGKGTVTELELTGEYIEKESSEFTNLFTKIELPTKVEELEDMETLAQEVYDTYLRLKEASENEEETEQTEDAWFITYQTKYEEEENRHSNAPAIAVEEYKGKLKQAQTDLETKLKTLEANAQILLETARNLTSRVQSTVKRYEEYLAELKAELGDGTDANKVSVYATEVELAEANAGELLKNLDLLANSRLYLNELGYGISDGNEKNLLSVVLVNLAGSMVNQWKEYPGTASEQGFQSLEAMTGTDAFQKASACVTLYQQGYEAAAIPLLADAAKKAQALLPEVQNRMCVLYSHISYFHSGHYRKDPDVIVGDEVSAKELTNTEVSSQKNQEKANANAKVETEVTTGEETKLSLDSDKAKNSMLQVKYSYTAENAEDTVAEIEIDGKVTTGTLTKILQTGLNLMEGIGTLLEKSRDNLYVDAYVMSMFPNYKEHYKGYDTAKTSSLLSDGRTAYLASYAEVEFIITGAGADGKTVVAEKAFADKAAGFGSLSVWSMRTKLFGTRMLFNSLSMLTDSAKLQQATALSSWAGPLAPLVSAVLVVCWIIAESVIDVMVLMGDLKLDGYAKDGEIPIFKQSQEWLFSLNGLAGSLAGLAVSELSDKILEKSNELVDSAETKVNAMIYKAYSTAQDGIQTADEAVSSALEDGKEQLTAWTEELESNISTAVQDDGTVSQEVKNQLDSMTGNLNNSVSEVFSEVENKKDDLVRTAQTVTENAKEQAVIAVGRMSDTIMEETKNCVESAKSGATKFISANIQKVIPTGTVVNGSKSNITMGYTDYLYLYLFLMNQNTKVQRIQAVIQANLQTGGKENFLMENAPVSVWADLECSMKYMFLSDSIVPEGMKKDGRMRFKVISAQSY